MDSLLIFQATSGILSFSTALMAVLVARYRGRYLDAKHDWAKAESDRDVWFREARTSAIEANEAKGQLYVERAALADARQKLEAIDLARLTALSKANAANARRHANKKALREADAQARRNQTVQALASTPLRPRDEVVAGARRKPS